MSYWLFEAESGKTDLFTSLSAWSTKVSSLPALPDGVRKLRSSRLMYIACRAVVSALQPTRKAGEGGNTAGGQQGTVGLGGAGGRPPGRSHRGSAPQSCARPAASAAAPASPPAARPPSCGRRTPAREHKNFSHRRLAAAVAAAAAAAADRSQRGRSAVRRPDKIQAGQRTCAVSASRDLRFWAWAKTTSWPERA